MRRAARWVGCWLTLVTCGAAGRAQAESSPVPLAADAPRPVVLIEHEISDASPFAAEVDARGAAASGSDVRRLPSVPLTVPRERRAMPTPAATAPAARWEPATRLEPAVGVPRGRPPIATNGEEGWRSIAPAANDVRSAPAASVLSYSGPSRPAAAPETSHVVALPIATVGRPSGPALTIPASGPWPPQALPAHPYAIGGVNPQVPAPRPETRYLSRNAWGETKEFVAGQPVRNAWKYLAP